jgi:hypothetical protein
MLRMILLAITLATIDVWAAQIEEVNPAEVRPTQAVVGYLWIQRKYEKFAGLSAKDLKKLLKEDPAPAIRGPGEQLFILDNHHEFYTLLELGTATAYVDVIADYSRMSWSTFYGRLEREGRVYLGDENGELTFTAETLPKRIAELRNDPYRALASFVRRADGFDKTGDTHIEFEWANYFRRYITLRMIQSDLEAAIRRGVELSFNSEAAGLPGFKGKKPKLKCEGRLKNS